MSLLKQAEGVYRGQCPLDQGSLGRLLAKFGAEIVVGHPTFRNADNIGKELSNGIASAAEVYRGRKAAFVISDGTERIDAPDPSTIEAALEAAQRSLSRLPAGDRQNIMVAALPYDGYRGDSTPGKGSALKLLFDEVALCVDMKKLILLDGDLRNDFKPWFDVFQRAEAEHRKKEEAKDFFITAKYARHFVDASLTRFVVGPLTTLMGEYVPGGISGDIVLSAGAVQHERDAEWDEHRRRYGTDIATTFDNIADPNTRIYEMYLGAKLHDITDEAKLSVMPGEVIGSALGRILHYEESDGRVSRLLKKEAPLKRPETWGPEKTGIQFIDPGYTGIFDVDIKRKTLVEKFAQFKAPMKTVLDEETFTAIEKAHARLAAVPAGGSDRFEFMGVNRTLWSDILYRSIAFLLKTRDKETAKQCLNYLYTAAFLEFCREKIIQLGAATFGAVRDLQKSLGVPPEKAQDFYRTEVDAAVEHLSLDFYTGRKKILEYMV